MSAYTSFVAVEQRVINEGGQQRTVEVPVEMPDGVSYQGIFGPSKMESQLSASYMSNSSGSVGMMLSVGSSLGRPAPPAAQPLPGTMAAPFALPPPVYQGMPRQIVSTTAPPYKPRGPIILPKGAFNVGRGKPVTSSDDFPIIGALSMVTDGDKGPNEGSWVELGPGPQWIQIDLQKPTTIYGLLIWHYSGETRVYRDVIIQIADDADFKKNVRTVYNNDRDNSSGLGVGKDSEFYETREGQWIALNSLKARYIRLYSRGNSSDPQNQYTEVEVWGASVSTAPPKATPKKKP